MADELITLLGGREIGRVRAGARGKLKLRLLDPCMA